MQKYAFICKNNCTFEAIWVLTHLTSNCHNVFIPNHLLIRKNSLKAQFQGNSIHIFEIFSDLYMQKQLHFEVSEHIRPPNLGLST